jgi:hypothetical protein
MVNMQLFVRGNEIKTVETDVTQPISQFKVRKNFKKFQIILILFNFLQLVVAKTFEIQDVSQMNLYLNGQPLNDELNLANYNVNDQSTIDLDIGLVGGKVHGSLARAGKVKGQTPKVS